MSTGDFLTLATLALAILIVTPFLGRYIHRVMEGERTFLSPILRPVERFVYRVCGVDETSEQDWKGYADLRPGNGLRRHRRRLRRLPPPGHPALQPGRDSADVPGPGVQHVGQLRDQHQLAELLRRDRRDLPDAGDGPGRPQLHVGRHRPGRGYRPHPRADPSQHQDARQLLGRPDPRRPLHPPPDLDRRSPRPRLAGRSADVEPDRRSRPRSQGATQTIAMGPSRLAGMDQGDGQQRRRVLQRELVAPVREPDAADELARDLRPPHDQLLADLHVRPVCRQAAPGLDDLRRDGRDPPGRRGVRHAHGVQRQPALPGRRRPGDAREHGGEGDTLRRRRRWTVHDSHDRHQHRGDQLLA